MYLPQNKQKVIDTPLNIHLDFVGKEKHEGTLQTIFWWCES